MAQGWVNAYIGVGSNLGTPLATIRGALRYLQQHPAITVFAVSPLYRSVALTDAGLDEPQQPDYLNAVFAIVTRMPARHLLNLLQKLENRFGRVRIRRWGARTLDLDLLLYGSGKLLQADLVVPHPELHRRAFVLYPLQDLCPTLLLPGLGPLRRWIPRLPDCQLVKLPVKLI